MFAFIGHAREFIHFIANQLPIHKSHRVGVFHIRVLSRFAQLCQHTRLPLEVGTTITQCIIT